MVILNLKGGLGNQLFQFIAAVNYASIKGCKLYIYTGNMSSYASKRNFSLELFIKNSPVEVIIINKKFFLLERHILAVLKKINLFIITEKNIFFKFFPFFNVVDDYFINTKFLDDRLLFFLHRTLEEKYFDIIYSKAYDFSAIDVVGLHIRGTDRVLENKVINYSEILKNISSEQYSKIYCFTDDIAYAARQLSDVENLIVYISDFNLSDLEEFYFISKINKFIVSNSTFSILARRMSSNETSTYVIKDFFKTRDIELLNIFNFESKIYYL